MGLKMRPFLAIYCLGLATSIVARNVITHLPTHPDHPDFGVASELQPHSLLGQLVKRDEGQRCGPGVGSCSSGNCCSAVGYCGKTGSHCDASVCQAAYGHCEAAGTPQGPPTDKIDRPTLGNLPYAPRSIRSCNVPGTIALTFDDGPNMYTSDLLDLLDKYNANVTFFITGSPGAKAHNIGKLDSEPSASILRRMLTSGHQIASHTWSHQDLSKISPEDRKTQLLSNEVVLRNVLGGWPTYMRPPYSSCTSESGCADDMGNLGYHIILYDIDTEDFRNDDPATIQKSKDIFDSNLDRGKASERSWLVIAHDVHEQTSHNLTEHMLKKLAADGYRAVTVGDCLGDPQENWYRMDDRVTGFPISKLLSSKSSMAASRDGKCANPTVTCTGSNFGPCCGSNKMCGSSDAHCGVGCNLRQGQCRLPNNGPLYSAPKAKLGLKNMPTSPKSESTTLSAVSFTAALVFLAGAALTR
ncbi:hypothetical protein FE257_011725 [Aspergillus nanangensis]|uniref:Chitin deacetylase n=1 Tax=Aspergillus nanangensis TaxID=2582783 RepID=A0AAD4CV62_ASPNN|nr:hypothetical protein FE257_011725 [Aspergillus nanangensis]